MFAVDQRPGAVGAVIHTSSMDAQRLRRAVRVGFWRRGQFRPLASIGLAQDGGIFVAPVAVRDYNWRYGVTQNADPNFLQDQVTVSNRPKLHYHHSGRAFVTLSGTNLPRRELQLPPIADIAEAQIMSVVVVRPWELAVAPARARDMSLVINRWPTSFGLLFSLISAPGVRLPGSVQLSALAPAGLLSNDDSVFLIDLSYYLSHTVLAIRSVSGTDETDSYTEPSITVAAFPWEPSGELASRGVLGLWTANLVYPMLAHALPQHLVSLAQRQDAIDDDYPFIEATYEQHLERIFKSDGTS